jgi:nucleoside phosphorylase
VLMDHGKVCDVCICCALWDEAKAVRDIFSELGRTGFEEDFTIKKVKYLKGSIQNDLGEALFVHLCWLPEMGPGRAAAHFPEFFSEFNPRFVGMTGICAADRTVAALGDLVVARFAYEYERGRIVRGEDGKPKLKPEIETFGPDENLIQWTGGFDSWKEDLSKLARPKSLQQQKDWLLCQLLNPNSPRIQDISIEELKLHAPRWQQIVGKLRMDTPEQQACLSEEGALREPDQIRKRQREDAAFPYTDPEYARDHVLVMGSGPAVRSDYPFPELQEHERKLGAIEMEAATFYYTANRRPELVRRCLVVKGVSDYADPEKDDSYREYASKAAAIYMFHFVLKFVNSRIMQRFSFQAPETALVGSRSPFSGSAAQRLRLMEKLNALPPQQFNMLVYSVKPPPGLVPPMPAPQGDRTSALLDWAESPGGCGVGSIEQLLETIIRPH